MTQAATRAQQISDLAAGQAGVASREQLRRLGIDADDIRNHIDAGRWMRLGTRVVALQTGPLVDEQARWWAVLDGGPRCALSGYSALHEHGLRGFPVERIQTAAPWGATRPTREALFIRRVSRRMTASDVHPSRRPAVLRVSAALIDALETTSLPLRGSALIAAVVQQRLIRADEVRPLIAATATLPHRRTYLHVAGDVEGGAHSLTEIDFHRLSRRARIPPPQAQSVRLDGSGRRRYLDADFGGWAAEVDGAVHLRPLSWWNDSWRMNEIVIAGKPTLRFPSVGIYLHRDVVIDQLQRAQQRWGGK